MSTGKQKEWHTLIGAMTAFCLRCPRFMQTDPILQDGDLNIYAYVGGDPINNSDPLGLSDQVKPKVACKKDEVCVIAQPGPHPSRTVDSTYASNYIARGDMIAAGLDRARQNPKDRRNPDQCPDDPGVVGYLSTWGEGQASSLNALSLQTTMNWEGGGAIGNGHMNFAFSPTPGYSNLGSMRSGFEESFGFYPPYDFHFHVLPGINGALLGFSPDDVWSTAVAATSRSEFQGSFVVMSDRVLYLSGTAAQRIMNAGPVPETTPGSRC